MAALACAALAIAPAAAEDAQPPDQPYCREFTAPVIIGGQREQAVGQACRQADGSWRITQETPGSPPLVYVVPPQTVYQPAPYWAYDPWFVAPAFGTSFVFVDRFHRHHHFHHGGFDRMGMGFHGHAHR
jgi:hypothetical protein